MDFNQALRYLDMNFDKYQAACQQTAIYPRIGSNYNYPLLGMVSEVGEIAGKFKKLERDTDGTLTVSFRADIEAELGDVLWYISAVADELGLNLDVIATANVMKLQSRKDRGVLQGSGDNR